MSRLGRLRVTTTLDGHVSVRTTNVSVFSLDLNVWTTRDDVNKATVLIIDGDTIPVDLDKAGGTILVIRDADTPGTLPKLRWKVCMGTRLTCHVSELHGPHTDLPMS